MVDWSVLEPFLGPILKLAGPYVPKPYQNYGYLITFCGTVLLLLDNRKLKQRVTVLEATKSHTMFVQTNPAWSGMRLGASTLSMGRYGCVTTAVAESLRLAGYPVDPGSVCLQLSANGGYTDRSYLESAKGKGDGTPGLINWWAIKNSYPQWSWEVGASKPYKLVQLKTLAGEHWVLYFGGYFYDPADGSRSNSLKLTYKPTGRIISADIVPAPPAPPTMEVIDVIATPEGSVKFDPVLQDIVAHASVNINRRTGGLLSQPVINVIKAGRKLEFTGKYSEGDGYTWVELQEGGWVAKNLIRFPLKTI